MRTVELLVNGQWQPVEVDDHATEKDFDEIATHLSGGGQAPAPQKDPESAPQAGETFEPDQGSTWYGRAGQYLKERGQAYAEAATRLMPTPTGSGGEPSLTQGALDAALWAGTGLAPELTALGLGAGTVARAAGLSEPAAEALETGTVLLGGGVKAASEGIAAAGTRAAAPAAAFERAKGFGTATPEEAGTALRATLPGAEAAQRAAFQEGTYDRIAKFADEKGLNASRENAVGQTLRNRLQQADDEWGQLAGSAEHKQVGKLLDKLRDPTPETTGIIDPATGQPVAKPAAPAQTVTWKELDDAEKALQKIRGPSSVRAAISDAKKGLLEGTPAADALETANQRWRLEMRPAKILANQVRGAESPVQAFRRVAGSKTDPQRLQIAKGLLETHHPEDWTTVVGGFYSDLMERAQYDPKRAAKLWQTVRPEIRDIVDPTGAAAKAFEESVPPVTPGWQQGAKYTAWAGIHGYGLYGAARRFYHGDVMGGLGELGLTSALAHPVVLGRIAQDIAPAIGQTGAAVAAGPAIQSFSPEQPPP